MLMCVQILPPTTFFYLVISSAGVHLNKFSSFCLISTKMPRKIFFIALWGAPASPALSLATPMLIGAYLYVKFGEECCCVM